jgi:hypothetical protein
MIGKDNNIALIEGSAMPSILAYHPSITVWTQDGRFLVTLMLSDWMSNDELFDRVRRASGCSTWGELIESGISKSKMIANGILGFNVVRSDIEGQLTAGADTPI